MSSFKQGSANGNNQNKASERDCSPKDEYYGQYKPAPKAPEDGSNPVRNDGLPARNLRSVGNSGES